MKPLPVKYSCLLMKYFKKKFALVLLPVLFLICLFGKAQHANISFEHYKNDNGLSAPVSDIVQDHYGFLWLGTTDGLNRFDGKKFISYHNIAGDSLSLPNNIINDLYVDNVGRVWIATNGGLCYYNFSDDAFHQIQFNDTLEKLDRHRIYALASQQNGTVWFATRTLLHRYSENKPVETIALPEVDNLVIECLHSDVKNRLWIGCGESRIFVYEIETHKFISGTVSSPFSKSKNIAASIHPILNYYDDELLIGSWYAGMQEVFLSGDSIRSIAFIDSIETDPRRHIVTGIANQQTSTWWVGTYGNGLAWFNPATKKFTDHFHHDPSDSKSLGDDYINCLFTDASGIVWIGLGSGLDKFDPYTRQFESVTVPIVSNEFSVYRLPRTIVQDRKNDHWLWITVSGAGLYHYNTVTQQFKRYFHDPANANSLPDDNIYTVFYDKSGRMWIGSKTGASLFDEKKEKVIEPDYPEGEKPIGIHKIIQDKSGRFWFSSFSNGVYSFDESTHKVSSYNVNSNSLPDNRVFCIMEDHEGKIWIGTQNRGLCCLNPSTGKMLFFQHDKKNAESLPDNGVYDLYEDDHHQLWIATENGLAEMNLSTFKIKTYTTNDGLCNNDVFSITSDQQKHLWLGTNNGLSCLDPYALTDSRVGRAFKNYFTSDGIPENHVSGGFCCSTEGTLYFGTAGLISFCHPETMKMNKTIPNVVITDFKIFDKSVPVIRSNSKLEPIHLSYTQNMISFEFSALNFTNAAMNRYAYKLDGFDADWIECGNRQTATYTNLDGGSYTFRVKAANNDGIWNEQGTSVLLTVAPPFWKRWWFIIFIMVVTACIVIVLFRYRVQQIHKLQNIRTRIARDLHDDIGSTLSSINMISSMAGKGNVPEKKSPELFHTISSASAQAMDLMNDIVWSINPKNDKMEMIIARMRQYAAEILEAANIAFTLEMDDESKQVSLPVEKRKDFYLIFKEAVNNLAKYSRATQAHIKISCNNKSIILSITDNGVGFAENPKSRNGAGNGLRNMKSRAAQLKGELTLTSQPNLGTTVMLKIPASP